MNIVVDINHPAHVHFFKNFIWMMEKKGHKILITCSKKDIAELLLRKLHFRYNYVGNYGSSVIMKIINLPILDLKMINAVKRFKPDIFLGIGSIRAAHASKIFRKDAIIFTDTEHSKEQRLLYMPFTKYVVTPNTFLVNLDLKKHIRYNGYQEWAYLHPKYFKPNQDVMNQLNLSKNDSLIVLRLVSWEATHDYKHRGIENIHSLIKELNEYGKVLITSEKSLKNNLNMYKINISPENMHDLMYYSRLYIGEGATMATESAIMGTPSIFVSSLEGTMGNLIELEHKYNLLYSFKNTYDALKKSIEILQTNNIKSIWKYRQKQLLNEKIDVTKYMVNLIDGYPLSISNARV